jgi:hypothetical protein
VEIIFHSNVVSQGIREPVREFGFAVIAKRNCLFHGTSENIIEAGDCYINRSFIHA